MRSNKGTRDELGWRRLTWITNEVLEEFRQNFSRCGNRDVSPLRPRHALEDYATNLKYHTSTIPEALLKVCVHILSFCLCFAFFTDTMFKRTLSKRCKVRSQLQWRWIPMWLCPWLHRKTLWNRWNIWMKLLFSSYFPRNPRNTAPLD